MNDVAVESRQSETAHPIVKTGVASLGLAALGIVFGDIGTSPLYTLKTVLALTGGAPSPETVLGVSR